MNSTASMNVTRLLQQVQADLEQMTKFLQLVIESPEKVTLDMSKSLNAQLSNLKLRVKNTRQAFVSGQIFKHQVSYWKQDDESNKYPLEIVEEVVSNMQEDFAIQSCCDANCDGKLKLNDRQFALVVEAIVSTSKNIEKPVGSKQKPTVLKLNQRGNKLQLVYIDPNNPMPNHIASKFFSNTEQSREYGYSFGLSTAFRNIVKAEGRLTVHGNSQSAIFELTLPIKD